MGWKEACERIEIKRRFWEMLERERKRQKAGCGRRRGRAKGRAGASKEKKLKRQEDGDCWFCVEQS